MHEKEWSESLKAMDSNQQNFWKEVIERFFIPDGISPTAFKANINALSDESFTLKEDPLTKHLTSTISKYTSPIDRPLAYPLWFFAAYPDVIAWITHLADNSNTLLLKIFECKSEREFEEIEPLNASHEFKNPFLRKLVDYYLHHVIDKLETRI